MTRIGLSLAAAALALATSGAARAGTDLYVTNYDSGTIGEYDATSGAAVNAALVTGLNEPIGLALSGGDLFVANYNSGTIGEYNATTGTAINATLISGLNAPYGPRSPAGISSSPILAPARSGNTTRPPARRSPPR